MIYRLRKKFIVITAASVGIVFALVFGGIYFAGRLQLNHSLDMLADVIAMNDGVFPDFNREETPAPPGGFPQGQFLTPETQFSTRFFTIWVDGDGNILRENVEHISSVSEAEAGDYAKMALDMGKERGWLSDYRYKVSETEYGRLVVFINGETSKAMTNRLLYTVFFVLAGSFILILLLILLISKKAVKPAAESYEKQKQFITDANHELKTPLTLILSNVDIVESELGRSEWLDDIRSEGERMGALINQLAALSRMDEDHANLTVTEFNLSEVASDTVSEFAGLAAEKHKRLAAVIEPSVWYRGDEGLVRRLLCILLDNAVKYCDLDGAIQVNVWAKGRYPVITVENSYRNVEKEELNRFFDRFYRADKARTFNGGFGVGLSIAKGIARKHKGDIVAYQKDSAQIGFKVTLK